MAKAQTSAQVIVDYTTGELDVSTTLSFDKIRKMRRQPTINLCRRFAAAPILASTWDVEGDDPDQVEFIKEVFLSIRTPLLRTALFGLYDFGWKAYELVYGLQDFAFEDGRVEKLQTITQVKPLKNDDTRFRYKKETGEFLGLATVDIYSGEKLFIDADHSLAINFDDEGLGNYGEGVMHVVEAVYDCWNDANATAARYDKKMAGTFLVVYYPVGNTNFNGTATENSLIATEIIKALRSSGSVSIPVDVQNLVKDLNEMQGGWKIEFLDPQSKQASFVDRQKYLDALFARGSGLPERAILEGEFGTKAEAGIHASAALLTIHLTHENITELLNLGPVNRLLRQNWGTEGTAWLKAMPLTDEKQATFQQVFTTLLADPVAGPDIANKIDTEALAEAISLPMVKEDEADAADSAEPIAVPMEPAEPSAPSQRSAPSSVSIQVG